MNSYIYTLVWLRVFLRFTFMSFLVFTSVFLISLLPVAFTQLSFGVFYAPVVNETFRAIYVISIAMGVLLTVSPQGRQIVNKKSKEFLDE